MKNEPEVCLIFQFFKNPVLDLEDLTLRTSPPVREILKRCPGGIFWVGSPFFGS